MPEGRLDVAVAKGRRALRDALEDIEPGERVVVALSGGADSLALAACFAFEGPKAGWDCHAVVVDHGLQDGSADVAEQAAGQARGLGLTAEVVPVLVEGDGGVEAAARRARYAALEAQQATVVLLAHTMDDQAETVLLGLGRGSGPRSIAGMPSRSGVFHRPFLGIRRAETERMCAVSGLEPWSDPHNADPRFRRPRVRHEVVPLLEDVLGGGVVEALARTAGLVRQDVEFLDALATEAVSGDLGVAGLLALPRALRSRVLRTAALGAGASATDLSAGHVDALDRLVTDWHGQTRVELPGGVSAMRDGEALHFVPTPVGG
ncbi:MAG: tRNA lysidine(34) synthetase TilS [Aeromicrobium sp.]